ncbi:MAG TPA: hypothetical protein VGN35_08525 [Jatrophihabitantaceae bacterium]|jgi:hypothetical protein|nr:hypothetical protein [Jatrophihabitantaceae bacterium]
MSDARLRTLLGTDPPASVLALDESARAELADVITDALRQQARDMKAAYDASMRHVPFPVRGIVKKVLGG